MDRDNESAINLAENPANYSETKHIRLRYHGVRTLVEYEEESCYDIL